MPSNQAAFLDASKARLRVADAPIEDVKPGSVQIETAYIGVAPFENLQVNYNILINSYPYILGQDYSGIVKAVGKNVSQFKVGQRVLARQNPGHYDERGAAHQLIVNAPSNWVIAAPDNVSLADASGVIMAYQTAAEGLYPSKHLGLATPKLGSKQDQGGKTVVVLGGASTVGQYTVQLAFRSGYKVVATSSPHNFDLVKSLGATAVVDYKAADTIEQLKAAVSKAGTLVGTFIAAGYVDSFEAAAKLGQALGFSKESYPLVSAVYIPVPEGYAYDVKFLDSTELQRLPEQKELGESLFAYLTKALETGQIKPVKSQVVGHSLEDLQGAMDKLQSSPPSAVKYVVKVGSAE